MAFNGAGIFSRLYNWVSDKTNSIPITASRMDAEFDGIATALSQCVLKDGTQIITSNIPMNNHKFTGLSGGSARNDSIALSQVQDGQFIDLGLTGGSADAYTLTPNPNISTYVSTMEYNVKIHATNATTTPYLQISSIANPSTTAVIKKLDASKNEISVEIGDLVANGIYKFKRNSANDCWIVLNPEKMYINTSNLQSATSTSKGLQYFNQPITISNNVSDANNDIDFSAGNFTFSDYSGQAVYGGGTGQLDVLFGSGNGMLATGSKQANSAYHLFMIYNPTTLTAKPLAVLDNPDPTSILPSGYTKYSRLGTIITDGSSNINQKYFCKITSFGQIATFITGEVASGVGTIPLDDTLPQNTEGTQFMEIKFSPLSPLSKLYINVSANLNNDSGSNTIIGSLFRDSNVNSIATGNYTQAAANYEGSLSFSCIQNSNATTLTAFKFRAGVGSGTTTFNGNAGVRQFGGSYASSITIYEYV